MNMSSEKSPFSVQCCGFANSEKQHRPEPGGWRDRMGRCPPGLSSLELEF